MCRSSVSMVSCRHHSAALHPVHGQPHLSHFLSTYHLHVTTSTFTWPPKPLDTQRRTDKHPSLLNSRHKGLAASCPASQRRRPYCVAFQMASLRKATLSTGFSPPEGALTTLLFSKLKLPSGSKAISFFLKYSLY
jgi:hypothetical protein